MSNYYLPSKWLGILHNTSVFFSTHVYSSVSAARRNFFFLYFALKIGILWPLVMFLNSGPYWPKTIFPKESVLGYKMCILRGDISFCKQKYVLRKNWYSALNLTKFWNYLTIVQRQLIIPMTWYSPGRNSIFQNTCLFFCDCKRAPQAEIFWNLFWPKIGIFWPLAVSLNITPYWPKSIFL